MDEISYTFLRWNSLITHFTGRRASFGAITLLKLICFSAGGPFFGWPRMMTESPERTYEREQKDTR